MLNFMPYTSINLFETPNNMDKCLNYLEKLSSVHNVKFRIERRKELNAVVGLSGEEVDVKKVEKRMQILSLRLDTKFC